MLDVSPLYVPFQFGSLELSNRIVLAPMTRMRSPGGVPNSDVTEYYRRRTEGGTGLIISEGTLVNHPVAGGMPGVPDFHGGALDGWRLVVEAVHQAGGSFFPQLWHLGMQRVAKMTDHPELPSAGPSGLSGPDTKVSEPMTDADIADVITAFAEAAKDAKSIGCDGVEFHGAHGYLLDQFFWEGTNLRMDRWGGDLTGRMRFAAEIIRESRRLVGEDFPMIIRFSQWKSNAYDVKLAESPSELERFLGYLIDAGISGFHCSTRRFWEPEFDGSDLNLAGWTKKLTGLPTISVGSVGLDQEFSGASRDAVANFSIDTLHQLVEKLGRGDFDLIAVGRALIANPDWAQLVREGRFDEIKPYDRTALTEYY